MKELSVAMFICIINIVTYAGFEIVVNGEHSAPN